MSNSTNSNPPELPPPTTTTCTTPQPASSSFDSDISKSYTYSSKINSKTDDVVNDPNGIVGVQQQGVVVAVRTTNPYNDRHFVTPSSFASSGLKPQPQEEQQTKEKQEQEERFVVFPSEEQVRSSFSEEQQQLQGGVLKKDDELSTKTFPYDAVKPRRLDQDVLSSPEQEEDSIQLPHIASTFPPHPVHRRRTSSAGATTPRRLGGAMPYTNTADFEVIDVDAQANEIPELFNSRSPTVEREATRVPLSSTLDTTATGNPSKARIVHNPYVSQKKAVSHHNPYLSKVAIRQNGGRGGAKKGYHNPYRSKIAKKQNGSGQGEDKGKKYKGTRIKMPGESGTDQHQEKDEVLPWKMNPFDRFFAALFKSSPVDYAAAEKADSDKALALWTEICKRAGLEVPTQPIHPSYENKRDHFDIRAALVLEESRHAISDALARKWKPKAEGGRQISRDNNIMYVTSQLAERSNKTGLTKVSFVKSKPFSRDELFNLRPGTVFECLPRDNAKVIAHVTIGVVLSGNRDKMIKDRSFKLLFCREAAGTDKIEDVKWNLRPIAGLITELRCFEAMSEKHKVGFLNTLLGGKTSTHFRFDGKDKKLEEPSIKCQPIEDFFQRRDTTQSSSRYKLPRLNPTQDKAATTFLKAKDNSITLVQGPPGTGKTTLLVSIICRYIMQSKDSDRRRLMVCAPTNKAISVIAARFIQAIDPHRYVCNAVLVGDAEKLLDDERSSKQRSNQIQLKSMFLYTWLDTIMADYRKLRNCFLPGSGGRMSNEEIYMWAVSLEERLLNGLPFLQSTECVAITISAELKKMKDGCSFQSVVPLVERLLKDLNALPTDNVLGQLMSSAHVIFCTLSSSGGMACRNTIPINDLIVDEAAASTEPELSIPFHLLPSRLLAVGDPLQLPATVLSRRATSLGLAKSLHERLMFDCKFDHVLLDVQYRMKPEISTFPSFRFYESKVANGENVTSANYGGGANLFCFQPYTFLQIAGMEEKGLGGSYRNDAEAQVIVELITRLENTAVASNDDGPWHSSDRIRVITFYQAQVALIKKYLRLRDLADKIVVATVDSSQGCEADIVLVSFVRSRPTTSHQNAAAASGPAVGVSSTADCWIGDAAGFLTDDRRMNVALTRAKYQLICVGNVRGIMERMRRAETLQLLANDAQMRNVIRQYDELRQQNHRQRNLGPLDIFYGPPNKKLKSDLATISPRK